MGTPKTSSAPLHPTKPRLLSRKSMALTEQRPPSSALHGGTTAVSSDFCRPRLLSRKSTALTEQRPPWRDDLRVVPLSQGHGREQGKAAPSSLPIQQIQLSLIWPVLRTRHQAGPHGIFDHIPPLFVVALHPPQLGIPKIALPDWRVSRFGPIPRGMGFPIRNPLLKQRRLYCRWGAEQVQVIRHENIPAYKPRMGITP